MCGRKEVDMSDDRWKVEDIVLFSIYTPVTTVSVGGKQVLRMGLSCSPLEGPRRPQELSLAQSCVG